MILHTISVGFFYYFSNKLHLSSFVNCLLLINSICRQMSHSSSDKKKKIEINMPKTSFQFIAKLYYLKPDLVYLDYEMTRCYCYMAASCEQLGILSMELMFRYLREKVIEVLKFTDHLILLPKSQTITHLFDRYLIVMCLFCFSTVAISTRHLKFQPQHLSHIFENF